MTIYLIARRKDEQVWLLEEASNVEETGLRDIVCSLFGGIALHVLFYFEAPGLLDAQRVLAWVMDGTPKIVLRKRGRASTWEEVQLQLPKERLDVQAEAEDQPRPQALRLLGADAGGGAG